jgi:predicted helicase
MLQSVNCIVQKEFGVDLDDDAVTIIDPFTGTGIFLVRLLDLNLIRPEKFLKKIIAYEIVLFPYLIAQINIEDTLNWSIKQII